MSRIKLADIPALTLYKDEPTLARRGKSIPQLVCKGKACKVFTPDVIRCTNIGGRGTEVDWKCETDLPDTLRLGRVEVSCEGWEGPGDLYVLKGSCSLEYRLLDVPRALQQPRPSSYQEQGSSSSAVFSEFLFLLGILGVLLFILYRIGDGSWFSGSWSLPRPRPHPPQPGPTPGSGWFSGGSGSNNRRPPPPYSEHPSDSNFTAKPAASAQSLFAAVSLALSVAPAFAQVSVWGQCGGVYYSGSTTCDSGSACTYVNDYYSQCLPGTASSTASTTTGSTTPSSTSSAPTGPTNSLCSGSLTKFTHFGVSESGAEFGNTVIPGVLGTDYTWPSPSSIDFFVENGFNTFRIPFLMERLSPPATGLTGPFDSTYLSGLTTIVNYITGKGAFALIDPHNYMIYNNAPISDTATFQTWWTSLANEFKSNPNVMFDVMNEPNGIPASTAFALNQAAVNGIRASGATEQLILVEGTSWTGAWTWTTSSGNSEVFGAIQDPNNNLAIEMHQYLDSDGSGTNATCVSPTIGAERLADATTWLQQNNLKGFLGEIGAGSNQDCITAVQGALCSMQQSGVWIGALWWAAGPWWGDYFTSIEPPDGPIVAEVLPQALEPFL
ncbi:glycoside hydrolase superfamily [Gloeopeniophorella convolvens]|nr:glycoside hydrolase superfamily [Gloeopeniophorella convolvens]